MAPKKRKVETDDDAGEGSSKAAPQETTSQRENRQLKEKTDKYVEPAQVRDAALSKSCVVMSCVRATYTDTTT